MLILYICTYNFVNIWRQVSLLFGRIGIKLDVIISCRDVIITHDHVFEPPDPQPIGSGRADVSGAQTEAQGRCRGRHVLLRAGDLPDASFGIVNRPALTGRFAKPSYEHATGPVRGSLGAKALTGRPTASCMFRALS